MNRPLNRRLRTPVRTPLRAPLQLSLLVSLLISVQAALPVLAQDWVGLPLGSTEDVLAIDRGFSERLLVGRNGLMAESSSGRTVWSLINLGLAVDLHSIRQPAFGQIWISGDAGVVRVKELGVWKVRDIPNPSQRYVMYSRGSGTQNALGDAGAIYQSLDSGKNWSSLPSGVTSSLNHGAGFITNSSWVVGDGGVILHSDDGGATWVPENSGTTENLNLIVQIAQPWLLVVGDNGTILRSVSGSGVWTAVPPFTTSDLNGVSSSGQNGSWLLAVGDGGVVFRSTDAGATWCQLDAGTSADLYVSDMVTNAEYIVGGAGGVLRRTTNAGGSCAEPVAVGDGGSSSWALRGPFPHPVRGAGHFSLRLGVGQYVTAKVFDLRGRHLRTVFEGSVSAGDERRVALDTSDWPAGSYFLRVTGERFSTTRKMVVLR